MECLALSGQRRIWIAPTPGYDVTDVRPKEEPVSASGRARFTPGNTEIGSATTGGDKGTEVTVRSCAKQNHFLQARASKRTTGRCPGQVVWRRMASAHYS